MVERKISKFLKKLFDILDNPEYNAIISWGHYGQKIIIKDQEGMQNDVIPRHFSLRKFSSFIRQLHLYNFHKEKSKKIGLIFSNTHFQRQNRQLALKIVRKRKTKGQKSFRQQVKRSQRTIQLENQSIENKNRIFEISQGIYFEEEPEDHNPKCKNNYYKDDQHLGLKSYSQLQDHFIDPYDILNIL